jgi:caffeoyl-CoA O-methyltransferase
MEFISEALDEYVCNHTDNEPNHLYHLNRETHLKISKPRMISGHFQGRVLSMFSKMIQPRYILEIGTYTGYSALCLAEGLRSDGHLYTIDNNPEQLNFVKQHFTTSAFLQQITPILGTALEIIPTLDFLWDIVFIDADKPNYLNYYHAIIDRVASGGYILADNILWSGKVVETNNLKTNDHHTQAILDFNTFVQNDSRVENVLFPIRDGLMLIRKK